MDNVSFNINNKYCNLNRRTSPISFGQIHPEHLFIRMENNNGESFGKDLLWADEMIKIIDRNKEKIKKSSFENILSDISTSYHYWYSENDSIKTQKDPILRIYFGVLRKARSSKMLFSTIISEKEQYAGYVNKFLNSMKDKNDIIHINSYRNMSVNKDFKRFTYTGLGVPLSTILVSAEKLPDDIKAKVGNDFIAVEYAPAESLEPVLKHIEGIYNNIIDSTKNKNKVGKKQLNIINKQIAEIQWYFAQATPYYRGSAGIADVFTKTLYEGLGIQVSPWKEGMAPDLEAYVRPLDNYVENYTNFFETAPKIMKSDNKRLINNFIEKSFASVQKICKLGLILN